MFIIVYHRVDLSGYRDEDRRGAVMRQVALLTLKYIFRRELGERLRGILLLLRDLEQSSSGLDFIRALLPYLAQVVGTDRLSEADFRQAVTQALSGGGELMMTIAEQWEQQGIEKGEAKALLRQIHAKFGPPEPAVAARIQAAESAQLERCPSVNPPTPGRAPKLAGDGRGRFHQKRGLSPIIHYSPRRRCRM